MNASLHECSRKTSVIVILTLASLSTPNQARAHTKVTETIFTKTACPKSGKFLSHHKILPSNPSPLSVQPSGEADSHFARAMHGDIDNSPIYLGYCSLSIHVLQNLRRQSFWHTQ